MMELLPTAGWSDVARHRDLDALEQRVNDRITAESALLRAEIAELRAEVKTDIAELRTEVRTQLADLRTDLRAEFADFRDQLHRDQRSLQRQIILALIVALVSMVVASAGLG